MRWPNTRTARDRRGQVDRIDAILADQIGIEAEVFQLGRQFAQVTPAERVEPFERATRRPMAICKRPRKYPVTSPASRAAERSSRIPSIP